MGDFLIEGSGEGAATQLSGMTRVRDGDQDALVPGTAYNATGNIDCLREADAPAQVCTFGLTRQGNGSGTVTVAWPDGGSRTIFFEAGIRFPMISRRPIRGSS